MIRKLSTALIVTLVVAGCEPERGAGFTGIGVSQAQQAVFDLRVAGSPGRPN